MGLIQELSLQEINSKLMKLPKTEGVKLLLLITIGLRRVAASYLLGRFNFPQYQNGLAIFLVPNYSTQSSIRFRYLSKNFPFISL